MSAPDRNREIGKALRAYWPVVRDALLSADNAELARAEAMRSASNDKYAVALDDLTETIGTATFGQDGSA